MPRTLVAPVPTSGYPMRAARRANSRRDGSKLVRRFGIRLPAWPGGHERCLDQLTNARYGANA